MMTWSVSEGCGGGDDNLHMVSPVSTDLSVRKPMSSTEQTIY